MDTSSIEYRTTSVPCCRWTRPRMDTSTNEYRTTPVPFYPRTNTIERQSTYYWEGSTTENPQPRSFFIPLNTTTDSTTQTSTTTTTTATTTTTTTATTTTTTTTTTILTTTSSTSTVTVEDDFGLVVRYKERRIQPGTIVMMDSEYLKQNYMRHGLATSLHRALLADYFGLTEDEMKNMGMTVVAWGFSYQVYDKATNSHGQNRAPKFFCDFKFRSFTFNAGYVGADIKMSKDELDGLVQLGCLRVLARKLRELRDLKTIPERFGNFIKLTANNWRVNGARTLTVPEINEMLNYHQSSQDIEENQKRYFGHFARCPNH